MVRWMNTTELCWKMPLITRVKTWPEQTEAAEIFLLLIDIAQIRIQASSIQVIIIETRNNFHMRDHKAHKRRT